MAINVVYGPSAGAVGSVAAAGGAGQARERAAERTIKIRNFYDELAQRERLTREGMAARERESEADRGFRREMFGEEERARKEMLGEEERARKEMLEEQSRIEKERIEQQSDLSLKRAQKLLEDQDAYHTKQSLWESSVRTAQVEDEIRMKEEAENRAYSRANQRKVDKIKGEIEAIEKFPGLTPEQKADLIQRKQAELAGIPMDEHEPGPRIYKEVDPITKQVRRYIQNPKTGEWKADRDTGIDPVPQARKDMDSYVVDGMKALDVNLTDTPEKRAALRRELRLEWIQTHGATLSEDVRSSLLAGLERETKVQENQAAMDEAKKIEDLLKIFAGKLSPLAGGLLERRAQMLRQQAAQGLDQGGQPEEGGPEPPQPGQSLREEEGLRPGAFLGDPGFEMPVPPGTANRDPGFTMEVPESARTNDPGFDKTPEELAKSVETRQPPPKPLEQKEVVARMSKASGTSGKKALSEDEVSRLMALASRPGPDQAAARQQLDLLLATAGLQALPAGKGE